MNLLNTKKILVAILALGIFFTACKTDPDPIVDPVVKNENRTAGYSSKYARQWINLYMDIEKDLPNFRPAATSRALAYIWMAGYESGLPGMPTYASNSTKLSGLTIPALPKAVDQYNWNVALNAAIARTTDHFMYGTSTEHKGKINDLESFINQDLSATVSQAVFSNSQQWGRAVADAVIAYAKTDLEAETQINDAFAKNYTPPTGPGKWKAATGKALFPYWGKVRTFATFGQDLVSPPPPAFSTEKNSQYYKDFEEVYNTVQNLTYEDRWKAEFWSDDIVGLTFSPPARVFQIGNQMMANENLDLESSLEFLLKLGIAENDAAVAAWGSKYIYNVERPTHFIVDHIDPNFKTILGNAIGTENLTPPFPGYPSGHSTFGGLGISVMHAFFGDKNSVSLAYTFTDRCHEGRTEFNGKPRTYTTLTQVGEENAYSRIPLGVHPRFDCTEGLRLGKLIGTNAVNYSLKK